MKMRAFLILFFLFCKIQFIHAQYCTNDTRFTNQEYFNEEQISSQLNVTFANVINWKGTYETLKLDVYFPSLIIDTMPYRPLILLVHGGGLISGDKINYTKVCKEFAKRGFIAATINYRLGLDCSKDSISEEKAKYRAQQDIHAAFRFIVQNSSILRIDTSWMFIGGGSAGSVASLGLVYISQEEWNNFTPGIQLILGNLNNSGNNLVNKFRIKGIFNDWGAMLKSSIQKEEMIPMVSFHGDADSTVAIDSSSGGGCYHFEKTYGSRSIHRLLIENDICSDLTVKPGGGHGVYQDSIWGLPFRVSRAACFFKSLFCKNCLSFYQTDSVQASCSLNTKLEEIKFSNSIIVYPNPFKDKILVSPTNGNEDFILINNAGQIIFQDKNIENHDFSNLNFGIYLLIIKNEKGLHKAILKKD